LPGRPQLSYHEHVMIVDAIADHDPDRAESAMRLHLSSVADALRSTKKVTISVKEKEKIG
jgi:DNA-binding FadR family transcriptional regulator